MRNLLMLCVILFLLTTMLHSQTQNHWYIIEPTREAQIKIWIDPDTNCHYLIGWRYAYYREPRSFSITPRLNKDGLPLGCK